MYRTGLRPLGGALSHRRRHRPQHRARWTGRPGRHSGLRPRPPRSVLLGDIIVAVDDKPTHTLEDLVLAFEDIGVGKKATLTLEREGKRRSVEVELISIE